MCSNLTPFGTSATQLTQTLLGAQIELFKHPENYPLGIYTLPKELDEKVARLHLTKLGVNLEQLSQRQADYLGISVKGPYKSDYYRY